MDTMSNRERYKAIARFERPGDLWLRDSFWQETLVTWIENGAPPELKRGKYQGEYFGFDHVRGAGEIASGLGLDRCVIGNTIFYMPIPPLVPRFERTILEEDDDMIVLINEGGQTVEVLKNHAQRMPMYLNHPVKDWATWKEYKKRLDPDAAGRFPADWDAYVEKMNSRDFPVILGVGSFFGFLREWMGMESIIYAFYEQPDLVEDMMETMLHLELAVIERALKDLKVEQANFWEDMCYKTGPLISPDMFSRFMVPRYKQVTELLRSKGVDIIYVDSDGHLSHLIPLWLEAGVNFIWPFEVAANNDIVAVRKEYGRDLILGGGIDKRALIEGKEATRKEVMSKVPFLLESGGYFPCVDHLVPPDVTLENYQYYINCMREVGGLDKLSFA